MPSFIAYHWTADALTLEASARALHRLVARDSTPEQRGAAFQELMEGGEVAARCIAFDQFDHAVSQGRLGLGNPFEVHRSRLLELAREELKAAPVDSSVEGRRIEAASHASALHVLARAGDASDLPRVAAALSGHDGEDVLVAACLAAADLLYEAPGAPSDLAESLQRLALDSRRSDFLQEQAVGALGQDKRVTRDEALVEIATRGRYPASGHAARLLAHDQPERYRALLERLCGGWPESYPAVEVRRLLTEPRDEDS